MIVKYDRDVPAFEVQEDGVNRVTGQILIGPEDKSENIVMRRFRIQPGGNTPHHLHPHEHVVKVMLGEGRIVDGRGNVFALREGMSVFVPGGEKHQFRNEGEGPFEFLCIILNTESN